MTGQLPDGTPEAVVFDLDEDSVPEAVALDADADGGADVVAFDLDADSAADVVLIAGDAGDAGDLVAGDETPDAVAGDGLEDDSLTTPPEEPTDADVEQAQADLEHTQLMNDYMQSTGVIE